MLQTQEGFLLGVFGLQPYSPGFHSGAQGFCLVLFLNSIFPTLPPSPLLASDDVLTATWLSDSAGALGIKSAAPKSFHMLFVRDRRHSFAELIN